MANDVTDFLRQQLSQALQDAIGGEENKKSDGGGLGGKGMLAGAALAALTPMAKRGFEAYRSGQLDDFVSKLGTGQALEDVRSRFGGGDDEEEQSRNGKPPAEQEQGEDQEPRAEEAEGDDEAQDDDEREPAGGPKATGKGRRMPVQQAIDVGVPLETAYNQFTQFEDWPEFMHRVTRVSQEDDCSLSFATKIWGKTKEFKADIVTQRPEEKIKWRVSQGITHTGIVTFHELAPRLTRIEVTLDVDPGSLIEKAARGMRHVKRAVRADLHRFKAFIEMQENETGAWRGVIVDGELVEPHDESYDEERDYSDIEDAKAEGDDDAQEDDQDGEQEPEEQEPEEQEPEAEADEQPVKRRRPRERARKQPAPA
jgi:uncharacterized membrane protein